MNLQQFEFQPLTSQNRNYALDFLIPNEESCVTLISRIVTDVSQNPFFYYILFEKNSVNNEKKIRGVIMISKGGLIQHHFENPQELENSNEFQKQLKKLLAGKKLYCIMGDKNGSSLLINSICKIFDEKLPYENREYLLLKYHPENLPDFLIEEKPHFHEIVKCNPSNLEDLFELQKNYDIVEVLPPGKEFNEVNCKTLLQKNLETQMIYALKIEKKFVAKAGSNAIGKNFIQLGGVFTDEKFRGQGLAQILIKELCKTIRNMNKEPVLFVQVKNESAKRAYRKVGFVYQSDYTICYYN